MAKYYVTSGSLRVVVQAQDARSAALWAVHRALQQVLPEAEADEGTACEDRAGRSYMVLSDTIELNEIGFDGYETQRFATDDLVSEWGKLMIAVNRMQHQIMTAV